MSSVAVIQNEPPQVPTVASEGASIIQMIERAARDPNVDIDKFERLMAMKTLFAASEDSADYNETDRQGRFYAQSWLLTHFLTHYLLHKQAIPVSSPA